MATPNKQHNKTDNEIIAGLHLILSEDGFFRVANRSGSMSALGYGSPDKAWTNAVCRDYENDLNVLIAEITKSHPKARIGFHSDVGIENKLYHGYFLPIDGRSYDNYSAYEPTPAKAMAKAYADYLRAWEKFDDEYIPINIIPGSKSFYFKWPKEYFGFTTNMGDLATELLIKQNRNKSISDTTLIMTKDQVEIVISQLVVSGARIITFDNFSMAYFYEEDFNAYE